MTIKEDLFGAQEPTTAEFRTAYEKDYGYIDSDMIVETRDAGIQHRDDVLACDDCGAAFLDPAEINIDGLCRECHADAVHAAEDWADHHTGWQGLQL